MKRTLTGKKKSRKPQRCGGGTEAPEKTKQKLIESTQKRNKEKTNYHEEARNKQIIAGEK